MNRCARWLAFNLWYLRRPPWDTGVSPPELLEFIDSHPAGRALDLGCGTGTNLLALAHAGWQVIGVDFVLPAVRRARRRLARAGFSADIRRGDVTDLGSLSGLFDLILDVGCYHSLPPAGRAAYRANLTRLLAPGGSFLLYAHMAADPGIDQGEIDNLTHLFSLVNRMDSTERGTRPSVWLQFERPTTGT